MSDECDFWGDVSVSSSRLQSRERAQKYQEILQQVSSELSSIDSLSHHEVLELVETLQDVLDDLWKCTEVDPVYPEKRMEHLLQVLSGQCTLYAQRKLSLLDMWKGSFHQVHSCLHDNLTLCEKWQHASESLTTHWKQYSVHQWKGERVSSPLLGQFISRLEQVHINQ